jgi:hypothetical protein
MNPDRDGDEAEIYYNSRRPAEMYMDIEDCSDMAMRHFISHVIQRAN